MLNRWCCWCCEPNKEASRKPLTNQHHQSSQAQEAEHLISHSEKPVENNHAEPASVIKEPTQPISNSEVIVSDSKTTTGVQEKHKEGAGATVRFQTPCTATTFYSDDAVVQSKNATENNRVKPGPSVLSASGRPLWTLSDELEGNNNVNVNSDSVTQVPTTWSNQHRFSSPDSCTRFSGFTNGGFHSSVQRPAQTYSPQGHQHPPSFFLPRTPTDITAATSTDELGDVVMRSVKSFPLRRGSMIVRSGRTTNITTMTALGGATDQSGPGGSPVEGFIVTPFAQVLVSMQRIRSAFIRLTSAQSSHRFGVVSSAVPEPAASDQLSPESNDYKTMANETLEELEWCLKQLENIQTKRPVSDMAFSKFKRLLNKELNSFSEADKSRHEISAYICGTFLEDAKDAEVNQEIEQMMEQRRSSGQSHSSASNQEQTSVTSASKQRHSAGTTGSSRTSEPSTTPSGGADQSISTRHGSKTSETFSGNTQVDGRITDGDNQTVMQDIQMPVNGIVTPNDKELDERFVQTLDTWGADIFEIDRLSDGHALTTTAYRIFQKRDLMHIFSIDPATLVRYLLKVESSYHSDVPYHNSLHAADVTQTSHFLLQAETLEDVFGDLEILAVIFASIVHDVDHPGLTNQFLVNSGHDLALQYNDTSVLENHHLYVAFKLLNEPDCDVFAQLSSKKRQTLRRMVIELVLATDMSKHMSLLADLRTMVETKKVSGSGVLNLDNYSDRLQILQNMIHCADLSNPAKPLRLNRKWTGRLMEEFFRQGDRERKLKLEISPMCDRESVAIEKSQVSFIDFVAHPLLESWCDLVHPSAQMILDILADNRDWYESQAEGQKTSGISKGRPKLATAEEDEEELAAS